MFYLPTYYASITPPWFKALFIPTKVPVHDGEVPALAVFSFRCRFINLFCLAPEFEAGAYLLRSLDREVQILLHETDAEPAAVISAGRGTSYYTLDGVVDLARPAPASADVDQVAQNFGVQAPLDAEVHGFGRGDVVDGQEVVVSEFPGETGSLGSAVHDLLAHH